MTQRLTPDQEAAIREAASVDADDIDRSVLAVLAELDAVRQERDDLAAWRTGALAAADGLRTERDRAEATLAAIRAFVEDERNGVTHELLALLDASLKETP